MSGKKSKPAAKSAKQAPPRSAQEQRPRDSATLILLDGPPQAPRVLLGKRSERHVFMPGRFVFPGGAIDDTDHNMAAAGTLDSHSERRLLMKVERPAPTLARALALAAIRETCEETGLVIGAKHGKPPQTPAPAWKPFMTEGHVPNLAALTFVARAITPPGRTRMFDARFFVAHRRDVATEVPDVVGPESELVELRWLTIDAARAENLPGITKVLLAEIELRLKSGLSARAPVPFYYFRDGRSYREEFE